MTQRSQSIWQTGGAIPAAVRYAALLLERHMQQLGTMHEISGTSSSSVGDSRGGGNHRSIQLERAPPRRSDPALPYAMTILRSARR